MDPTATWPDFGPYTQLTPLAQGGMGEIWLARQSGHGGVERRVVLKRALPGHAADPDYQDMFLREARIAASLEHPNVARVYDSGIAPDGRSYLAMEYVHGVDLRALLRAHGGRALPSHHAVTVATGLAAALGYVHARADLDGRHLGLVHRDVSPGNVLLSYDGAIKLTDFGVARADAASLATQSGAVKGKLAYMAPEQARGEALDPRADLYALGVVLFEMLVGRRPFGRTQDVALLYRLLEEDAPDPATLRPTLPPALGAIVRRLLARDKEARFDNAAEVRDTLEQVAAAQGWVLSPPRLGTYAQERCGRRELPALVPTMSEGLDKVQSVSRQSLPPSRGRWLGLAAGGLAATAALAWFASRPEAATASTLLPPFPTPTIVADAGAEPEPKPEPTLAPDATPEAALEPEPEPEPPKKRPSRRKGKRKPKKRPLDSPLPFGK